MDLGLTDKVVLISGGSRGIGLAIVKAFAKEGAITCIMARGRATLEQAKSTIGERSSVHLGDATEMHACVGVVADVQARWGRLDVLVTCAGSGASVLPGEETSSEWRRVVDLNLFSATNLITAATPALTAAAPSSIVCISSICGREALGAPVTYSAAKSALNAAVKGLSRPLARCGIRMNIVSPGNIFFPGGTWDRKIKDNRAAVDAMLQREVPLGCLGEPEAVADAVLFLASHRASFITGSDLVVDGGQTRS